MSQNQSMNVVLGSVAFWAPVKYAIPGDDAKPEIIHARARFKRLKTSERKALEARLSASGMSVTERGELRAKLDDPSIKITRKIRAEIDLRLTAEPMDDDEFLAMLLVDWELKDRRGESIPCTPAKLAEICEEWDGFEGALVTAYFSARREALNPEAIAKNSEVPSGTGS